MPLRDALSAVLGSHICWIIMGVATVLGLLRGLWKGLFKRKKAGADYLISLLIYMVTDAFIFLFLGAVVCVLLQYLPALLGFDTGLFGINL